VTTTPQHLAKSAQRLYGCPSYAILIRWSKKGGCSASRYAALRPALHPRQNTTAIHAQCREQHRRGVGRQQFEQRHEHSALRSLALVATHRMAG